MGLLLCAQHGRGQGGASPLGDQVAGTQRTARRQAGNWSGREAGAERSGERNRGPTNRNRIRGGAGQGERAMTAKLSRPKARRRKSGGCAAKASTLTWGDLALCLKGRRREAEREVSRGRSSQPADRLGEGPNGKESETTVSLEDAMRQKSRQLELPLESRGEAPKVQRSGEAPTAANGNERSGTDRPDGSRWSSAAMPRRR